MTNIENMPANMINDPDDGDSSSSTLFENLDILNDDLLEVNRLNHNLVMFNDNFESDEGFVERGDEPFNTFTEKSTE